MLNWGAVDRILWMGVLCLVTWCACSPHHYTQHAHPQYSINCFSIEHLSEDTRNPPCLVTWCTVHHVTRHNMPIHNILSTAPQLSISQKALETLPEDGNVMPKHAEATTHN